MTLSMKNCNYGQGVFLKKKEQNKNNIKILYIIKEMYEVLKMFKNLLKANNSLFHWNIYTIHT